MSNNNNNNNNNNEIVPSQNADDYGNDPELEINWAMYAFKFAETYFKLLTSIPDLSALRLTRYFKLQKKKPFIIDQTIINHHK
jgi:hypothetical protein